MASSDAERGRGYASIAHVHWKRRDLAEAERATKKAMSYEKTWPSIVVALEQGSLETAEKLKEASAKLTLTERGTRDSQRHHAYLRGYIDLKSRRATEAVENLKEALRHRPPTWSFDSFEVVLPMPIWNWVNSMRPSPNTSASCGSIRIIRWRSTILARLMSAKANAIRRVRHTNDSCKSGRMPTRTSLK